MPLSKPFKTILFTFILTYVPLIATETVQHHFDVEQGFVLYEILGGAQLTDETNLNIQGTSRLRFKEWGEVMQEEDDGMVVTKGAINFVQEVKRLEKHIGDKVITVDYENEQLLERKKSEHTSSQVKETEGLLHRGQDVVAGVLCSVWVGPSIKKCIYKGVVLKQESQVLGVSYVKKAIKAVFDINASDEQCILPDFPIQAFSLFKDNLKTNKETESKNICKVFKDVVNEVEESDKSFEPQKGIDNKKREKFVNKIAEGIFKKQKEILPKLTLAMKKSRECLHLSEDLFERNQCVDNYSFRKSTLGIQEDDYVVFPKERDKAKLIDAIEDAIIDLQPRIPCVARAKNFIDISSCMK
jgi:predicted transcriptional regulator